MCTVSKILIKSIYPLLRHRASFKLFYPEAAKMTQVTRSNLTHSTYFVNIASKISYCQEKFAGILQIFAKNAHLSPLKELKNTFCTDKSTQNSKLLQKIGPCSHIIADKASWREQARRKGRKAQTPAKQRKFATNLSTECTGAPHVITQSIPNFYIGILVACRLAMDPPL